MIARGHFRSLGIALGLSLLAAGPAAFSQDRGVVVPEDSQEISRRTPPNQSGAPPQAQAQGESQDPVQDPAPAESKNAAVKEGKQETAESPADAKGNAARPIGNRAYALTSNYSVELPPEWNGATTADIPPPAPLGPYAPPFHLAGDLALSDAQNGAMLQFATSNNPFIGHDSYWLDTQIHSPSGSGMSLLDFFFYYFFPPSEACMHQILTTYADASRVAPTGATPSFMQIYYACPVSDTLSGFYSAQVSSGVTFRLTNDGTRVLAPVGDFYLAPMEEINTSGMTFFVFEAQGLNSVSSEAAQRFHLPANAQGGQPDFFWAIGSSSPFPFVADPNRKDVAIMHVAYARLGVEAGARADFLDILRHIRVR